MGNNIITLPDLFERAQLLRVVDFYAPNETGWVTPAVLYNQAVKGSDGEVHAPGVKKLIAYIRHKTMGSNTLRFWGEGGSARPGNWSCAHLLVPRDTTEYKDRKVHDTTNHVFKIVPDQFRCNHLGDAIGPFSNQNTKGCEYEGLDTNTLTESQYIKGALLHCYETALAGIPAQFALDHGIVREPWGGRTDPWTGGFRYAYHWTLVQAILEDKRIWDFWGLAQPAH